MYSVSQITQGIKNPEKVKEMLSRAYYEKYKYDAINNSIDNRGRNRNVALALNWGCHQVNHWPVAEYNYLVTELIERHNPVILPTQSEYDRLKEHISDIITFEPDSYLAPKINYDNSKDHTIGLITGHPHDKDEQFGRYIADNNINHLLSRYYDPLLSYFPEIDESKITHFPWAVPDQYVIPEDEIRFHNHGHVTIFGKTSDHPMYETRGDCRNNRFVTDVRSIETSKNDSKPLSDKEYYHWIRNFDAVIAAGSFQPKYQYTFAKYFEIPAAGSLLFAQYCSDLERLGFDETNCVIFNSMDDFEHKAEQYLSTPEEYLKRRRNGAELIRDRHTISDRIETIEAICTSL